jgi:hypothetical protein
MVIEFELALDDLKEANAAHMQGALRSGGLGCLRVLLMLPIVLIGLGTLATGLFASPGPEWSMVVLGGFLAVAPVITFARSFRKRLLLDGASADPPRPQRSPSLLFATGSGWLYPIVAVTIYMLVDKAPDPTPVATTVPAAGTGATSAHSSLVPWLLIFAVVWFEVFRRLMDRSAAKRLWERQPSLHLRKRFDVDENRLIVQDSQTRDEHKWAAIRAYVETPHLFILYKPDYTFHMIPKRAFAGPDDAEKLRHLLRAKIQPATMAFPVIPGTTP